MYRIKLFFLIECKRFHYGIDFIPCKSINFSTLQETKKIICRYCCILLNANILPTHFYLLINLLNMKFILHAFTVFLLIQISLQPADARQHSDHHSDESQYISVSATGQAIVPADIAVLSVNISVTNEDAEHAFNLHKERESFLADLLTNLELDDDQISYQPVSIRPSRQRDGSAQTTTSQTVTMELSDFDQLSAVQVELISNEFDNFSGSLASTMMEEGSEEALKNAIENARRDAEILAESSGKNLGDVQVIDYSSDSVYRPAALGETMRMQTSDYGPSLGDFSQTITVEKRIQIRFELTDE